MKTYNITYNNVDLHVRNNSMSITNVKAQQIRHYPGTNKSSKTSLGQQATTIACELVAFDKEEKLLMEQLMSTNIEAELYINGEGRYYKKVVTEGEFEMSQATKDGKVWTAPGIFFALDPTPYSIDTGEALY